MRVRALPRLARRAWGRVVARAKIHEWDEGAVLMAFGVAIGLAVGLAVVLFYRLVDLAYVAFAVFPAQRLPVLANALYRPLLTAVGLWAAWLVVRRLRLDDGQNVPDVQLAVAKRGGDVPLRPVAGRTVAAAVTLGAGGSAGSEGPVAVLGSALGSTLGRLFRFDARHRKILVGCGAAAGIAGAFGAPFAGAFFALEEVLGSFSVGAFSPVVIASVVGAITARAFLGDVPVVDVPEYGACRRSSCCCSTRCSASPAARCRRSTCASSSARRRWPAASAGRRGCGRSAPAPSSARSPSRRRRSSPATGTCASRWATSPRSPGGRCWA